MFASRSVGVGSVELGRSQIAIPLTSNFVALTGEWNGSPQWGRVLAYVPKTGIRVCLIGTIWNLQYRTLPTDQLFSILEILAKYG